MHRQDAYAPSARLAFNLSQKIKTSKPFHRASQPLYLILNKIQDYGESTSPQIPENPPPTANHMKSSRFRANPSSPIPSVTSAISVTKKTLSRVPKVRIFPCLSVPCLPWKKFRALCESLAPLVLKSHLPKKS